MAQKPDTVTSIAHVLLGVLLLVAVIVCLGTALSNALDLPHVHHRWPSGECVRVDDPAADHQGREPYTCDNLPPHAERVWVR